MPTATLPEDREPILTLDGGSDEVSVEAFMADVRSLQTDAAAAGVDLRWRFTNPAAPGWQDIGNFVIEHGGNGLTVLSSLLVTWLLKRRDRMVGLQIGDDRVEARNPKEVRELLEIGQRHRDAVAKRERKTKKRRNRK